MSMPSPTRRRVAANIASYVCGVLVTIGLGCAASPSARYYALQAMPAPSETYTSEISLVLGPWLLPQYLNRPQIVTPTASSELELAEFHRWAEPIENNFARVVAMNASTLLSDGRVYEFPIDNPDSREKYISGRVYRLDVDEAGKAVVDVMWHILDDSGRSLYGPQRSYYEEQATAGSHEAGVRALSSAVARFSRDLVEAAVRLPGKVGEGSR